MVVPLVGYLDRWSARPGETVAVKVSSQLRTPTMAELVRIRCADPNPAGPGMRIEQVAALGTFPPVAQPVLSGSCGIVELSGSVPPARPLHPGHPRAAALAGRAAANGAGPGRTAPPGHAGRCGASGGGRGVRVGRPHGRRPLVRATLRVHGGPSSAGADGVAAHLGRGGQRRRRGRLHVRPRCDVSCSVRAPRVLAGPTCSMAGWRTLRCSPQPCTIPPRSTRLPMFLLAWWDFSDGIGADRFLDRGLAWLARCLSQPAHPWGARLSLVWGRNVLAPCPARLRGRPRPCRRPV